MWQKVCLEPVCGAISTSILRALHEAVAQNPRATLIIVLEGDVEPTENTTQLIAASIANWFGNPELQKTKYVALTFSDWHSGYSTQVRNDARSVKNSILGLCLSDFEPFNPRN